MMSKSRSFDRASAIYDQTRLLLEPIAQYGIPALLDVMGPTARVLEVGSGTGRISIPLLERGVNLVGCDLSSPMLRRFQEKFAAAPIVQADAGLLPFPGAHFDAVLTVHVMHLIPSWREALREFRRVLKNGGVYLNVRTWASVGNSVAEQIREFWHGWLAAHGVDAGPIGLRDHTEFLAELRSLGADFSEIEAVRFPNPFHLLQELERFEARVYSETWDIPDDVFEASVKELRAWMLHEYGNLDREIQDEVRFVIHVARFEA
jgi:ubiquinone/menaquinone biosynthesis C-methylase UbiE